MTAAIVAGALAVAALNAVPGLLGGWLWHQGDPAERRWGQAFWVLLRIGQAGEADDRGTG